MIAFNFETSFDLENENKLSKWVENIIISHGFELGETNYIFCDDAYLQKLNVSFLNHDTLTDVISFDNTMGKCVAGDIFISVERITENAADFKVSFTEELHRVMIHGILHFLGFKDKSEEEKAQMRHKENESLAILNE